MISQSLFLELGLRVSCTRGCPDLLREQMGHFVRPYVLVIHKPTGNGFYLNRDYRHIIDVSNCQEPENPAEVARGHLCASSNLPAWVNRTAVEYQSEEFDTFWLY